MKTLLRIFKRLFCHHQWVSAYYIEHVPTSYGTFYNRLTLIKVCKKCGKIKQEKRYEDHIRV